MVMCRGNNKSRAAVWIWPLSFALFYFLFQMALHNSPASSSSSGFVVLNSDRRSILYNELEKDLAENGAKFLQGQASQSLSLSDLFTLKDGSVSPLLKAANPPVRAQVLYLDTKYSYRISEVVKRMFYPYFDKAIWFQNSDLYHFSMFHSSHHLISVPATVTEIDAEVSAVKAVAEGICPLEIVLDRVVLTSTGALIGCWQVNSGGDPIAIRAKLRTALPHAPEKQLYDAAILHTTFARLLGHPKGLALESFRASDIPQFLHELVARLNDQIHGFKAVVSELWYVEEYDVLALALDGRMKTRRFQLGCSKN